MARPQEFDNQEVLQKAMKLFWHKGYEATSLVDLLNATGLSKSSLYGTFGSKRELFLNAFDTCREYRAREMKRMLHEGNGRQAIEGFFRSIIADAEAPDFTNGCMGINEAVEMAPHDTNIRLRVVEDLGNIEAALTKAIKRGQADGSIGNTENPNRLAKLFLLGFPGLQVMVRAGCGKAILSQTLSVLLSVLD